MKLEELDMTEEEIADAGERIDTVVERFRATAGPEYYVWKLKYIDDLLSFKIPIMPPGIILAFTILMGLLATKSYLCLFILIGSIISLNLMTRIARGRILKEKIWMRDYVSNEDILYLCRNRALSIIIHDEVEDGMCYTHTYLLKNKNRYLNEMRNAVGRRKKRELLDQIKQQHS